MDATTGTLLGVVIGAALTQGITFYREHQQWKRQQEAEDAKRIRDEESAKKERERLERVNIRETYFTCIQYLSALAGREYIEIEGQDEDSIKPQITGEKRERLIEEAHKCLSFLALRDLPKDSDFDFALERFIELPDYSNASEMREQVVALAQKDAVMSPYTKESQRKSENNPAEIIEFGFWISDEYRKQQLIEKGITLPQRYEFSYELSRLSINQRQKLVDGYFSTSKRIPTMLQLNLPAYHSNVKKIIYAETIWKAKLNPKTSSFEEILKAWESDYEAALKKAHEEMQRHLPESN